VLEVAGMRSTPLAALTESAMCGNAAGAAQLQSDGARKAEQLVLLVRALQLLSSGLSLATQQLRSGQLRPSQNVKTGTLSLLTHMG